ncbi:MAG: type IV pilus biogenesis protein EbsA [Almyronema sp.]
MSISIDEIKPASKQDISVYMPYYQGTKRQVLPYAITLYKQGNLEGERMIEGGNSVPFIATWNVSMLPADLTHCRMQFDGDADLSYEVTMATFEFVDFLIDVFYAIRRKRPADFAKPFYRKLLRLDD